MVRFVNVLAAVILFDNAGKIFSEVPCLVLLYLQQNNKINWKCAFIVIVGLLILN
jgi:hypothetical protein